MNMRKLLRITFLASVLWNGLILLISPLVLQGYALSFQARKLTFMFARVVFSVIFGNWMDMGVIGVAFAMCLDWGLRALLF